mgnify:FL=1
MTEIKKNHSLRRIRLMKRAAVIRQNNGMDKREALVVAHQIDVLIRKMYLASVSFYYTKQDGSIRHAVGTLTGYEHCFHRPYTPRPETRSSSTTTSKPKAGGHSTPKISSVPNEDARRTQRVGKALPTIQRRFALRGDRRLPGGTGIPRPLRRTPRTAAGR